MKSLTIRSIAIGGAILLASLSLAGCTINLGSAGSNNDSGMMDNGGMMGSNSSQFSGTDIMFAQMMIVHHQQAVDMGTLAETRASNPEVKTLAAQIKSEQSPEITQMKVWLKTANAPTEMGHDMGMGGLLTDAQMTALKNASGAEFDRLYLEGMIGHHEGAIQMAQMVTESNNAEVKALGNAIIASQTKQIAYMKELLAKV
ncbi:DUF305 domain-containing protein [Candidatus Rhodoluna planktonica]|uniref:DUF305 domain-containing protein n=1 Tax=Candidatus Rhodoluna planktonica TaxID=535712 RepID=A0A1D9DYF5_9MICO|nr:DUF305 domain-containing protein [Candidatus Rhodoluna planktonica]AOY55829.1 hypothetical protein A4Z71_02235 [Candidatus Rhodoluna planktonica]